MIGRIIGIDLGTTNSSCAFVDMDGEEPRIIPNDRGNRLTPSIVAFTDDGILVGEAAGNQAAVNPERTVRSVKRLMGSGKTVMVGNRRFTPEQISSFILAKLKTDAEAFLGERIENAVITVPAYFTENQRRATKEAGRLAGLHILRVVNEPTAAALAYASKAEGDRNILVYDLGGGTFDVTYLQKRGNEFHVKASNGDNHLGGDDFDDLLLKHVLERFKHDNGFSVSDDPFLRSQLRDQVEKAKIELSCRDTAFVSLPFLSPGSKVIHLNQRITRAEFNGMIGGMIDRTIEITLATLREGGAGPADIGSLIFSGGSSRIPLVQSAMRRIIPVNAETRINPDEVVTLGAAVQASLLEAGPRKVSLHDVTPFSLGVEIEGGQFVGIIKKNSAVPVRKCRMFTTITDNQQSVEIHVLQGESARAADNTSLGRFLLSGIRQGPKGEPHIRVAFEVDEDGIVHVTAKDVDTDAVQSVSLIEQLPVGGKRGEAEADLDSRLSALADWISQRLAAVGELERPFRDEITQMLERAEKSRKRGDRTAMNECRIALETIMLELETYRDQKKVRYEGA